MKSANPRRIRISDLVLGSAGFLAASAVAGLFLWIVLDLVLRGWPALSGSFFAGEIEDSGRSGGIGPVLAATAMILFVCLAAAVPLAVGCAFWLSEFARPGGRLFRAIQAGIDLLASVPSIVFGLFGSIFFCQVLGLGFSIAAGGLTLACMILPILIRTTLASLQSAPENLRPGAAALGLTRTAMIRHLLLPAALPGIGVGLTLGIGRALAETAALIFTSGYATRWPSGFDSSGRALSVHIYDLAMNIPGGARNAAASALTLLLALLAINATASFLSERWLRFRHPDVI